MHWYSNGSFAALYVANPNHQFPRIIHNTISSEIVLVIKYARRHPGETLFYDMSATMVVNDATLLNMSSLECSFLDIREIVNIKVLGFSFRKNKV